MRYSLCVLCACVLCFFSCTQNKLEIVNSVVCPVFSYERETTAPSFHLGAYVRTSNEIGYLKLLQINSETGGFTWTVTDFQYVYSSNGKWAGTSGLCVPGRLILPNGRIKLTAVDADSQTVERTFNLSYPKKLLSLDYKSFLNAEDYQKVSQQYIVFYDKDGTLLNCTLKTDVPDINEYAKTIQNAVTARTLWFAKDKSFAVLSPPLALAGKTQK